MKKLVVCVTFLCLISCKEILKESTTSNSPSSSEHLSDTDFKRVKVDSLFILSVPKYMKSMEGLNEEASLQYANIYKETYAVVIHENKEEFIASFREYDEYDESLSVIENYSEVQTKMFEEALTNPKSSPYGLTEINGVQARQVAIEGESDGIKIVYLLGFIEGKENIFMVMNWTLQNRFEKYETTFEMINSSFNLLKG